MGLREGAGHSADGLSLLWAPYVPAAQARTVLPGGQRLEAAVRQGLGGGQRATLSPGGPHLALDVESGVTFPLNPGRALPWTWSQV